MLKIPTFVLGALLIITGLVGYLFQDPNLSINIVGPLADDAVFTLSDGNQTHTLDRGFASSNAAGEHAFWMVERLNQNHAKDRSQGNYAASKRPDNPSYKTQSFWYASSTGDTLSALIKNAETGQLNALETVDPEKAKVRFIYKKAVDGDGPVTLTSTNWMNVEGAPGAGEALTFGKSWTALIPAIIALVLIACVLVAEAKPSLRKHVMHLAATVGLLGLVMSAKKIWPAVSEMNWLKNDPNGIIHASSLKPAVMFFSAGLLFIFVALCILSFINARKEMAAQPKPKKEEKKKEEDFEDDKKDKDGKDSAKDKEDSDDDKKDTKSPAKPMGPAPKAGEGKSKTSKSTGSPFGEKKKVVPFGKPKSIDPEKARRPKSTEGQRDGIPKPPEKAKPFEQRSGESKRDEKPEPKKSSTTEDSKPRESEKPSNTEADSEKKPESQPSEKAKPFEQRSGESKRDEKSETEKSSDTGDSEPRESDKAEIVEKDKGTSDSDAEYSKPDTASSDEGKEDASKSEGDEQKKSPESSEKKED